MCVRMYVCSKYFRTYILIFTHTYRSYRIHAYTHTCTIHAYIYTYIHSATHHVWNPATTPVDPTAYQNEYIGTVNGIY
jgi:hypothetical protein